MDDGLRQHLKSALLGSTEGSEESYVDNKAKFILDDLVPAVEQLIKQDRENIAKAYGGCTNCYGKGYATVNDKWIAYDTDQDIGSPGGVTTGGNPNAMKFCTCERGKQLEQLTTNSEAKRE